MFICENCRQEVALDPNDNSAEILLALTKHQLEECVRIPKWALSMPEALRKQHTGHAHK